MTLPVPDYSSVDPDLMNARLKHYNHAYHQTCKITNALDRCGLNGQYWLSTKDDCNTAVIHHEDFFYEGPTGYVVDLFAHVHTAEQFIKTMQENMIRGEYPWIEFKKGGDNDGGESE